MAGKDRRPPPDLIADILREGRTFAFFQVVRLLALLSADCGQSEEQQSERLEAAHIRPDLFLGFPAADVLRVEETPNEEFPFRVTTTFLGLYGVSSPLPTFYTEDLILEDAEDESVTRDFVSFINHRLYMLLWDCWAKYRQYVQVVERKDEAHIERLYCLLGLGESELRSGLADAFSLLRYVGLFTQFPRSALGLATLLRDALGNLPIEIVPCITRWVKVPPDQRFIMGCSGGSLGIDALVGEEIEDRMGKFRVRVGPLTRDQFQSLLPQEADFEKMDFLTRFYVNDPLEYDIELVLAAGEAATPCMGDPAWSRLGWSTWVFSGETIGEVSATYRSRFDEGMRL
jgi:type VI secretion system protein ImpH